MRAVRISDYGGPEVIEHVEIPIPAPGRDEVLIRCEYAGVNFMDVHTRQGKYRSSTTYPVRAPLTLGVEGAGVVVEVGAGVDAIAVGERVAWCLSWGSYAEYAVVPARLVAKVPPELSLAQAAAAMFPGSTAHYLINDTGQLDAGMTCLVLGATGVIGRLLIQLARRAGARVIAVTGSAHRIASVTATGADAVLVQTDGFADRVRELTGGRGVDVVYDAIGRDTLRESLRATRKRGLVVNYGSVAGGIAIDPIELGESGSLFLTRPRLADHLQDAETVQRRAHDIFAGLLDGSLEIPTAGVRSLITVGEAHRALEERTSTGKWILDIAL